MFCTFVRDDKKRTRPESKNVCRILSLPQRNLICKFKKVNNDVANVCSLKIMVLNMDSDFFKIALYLFLFIFIYSYLSKLSLQFL